MSNLTRGNGRSCKALLSTLAAALALSGAPVAATAQSHHHGASLPNLGDGNELTLSAERRLGDRIARSIYRDPDYLDDPILSDYLQTLWLPLLAAAQRRGDVPPELTDRFAWQLVVSRDRTVNAFALPGGYLGVHLGLVAATHSADELASVLAHELSHVSQRHIARLLSRQRQQAPWVLAAAILGALAASAAKNADIATAAIASGQALAVQQQLSFSRDMEREADRVGFGVLTDAGFDGAGFPSMFERLQQSSRLNDDGSYPYLRSHPLTTERMADMRARLPLGAPGAVNPRASQAPSVLAHALVAARARSLSETNVDRLRALVQAARGPEAATTPHAQAGRLYAGALAAVRLRDAPQALELLETLHKQLAAELRRDDMAETVFEGLAVEALMLAPSRTLAGRTLDGWSQQAQERRSRAGLLLRAQAAVALGQPAVLTQASQALQARVAERPGDALAWQALGVLSHAQGQTLRAVRAEAEAQVARLDYSGALERLRAAQGLARGTARADHIELSIIDARVREVERLLRETERDERDTPG